MLAARLPGILGLGCLVSVLLLTGCDDDDGERLCASCDPHGSPACQVTPAALQFGTVGVGLVRDSTLTIVNNGGGRLTGRVSLSNSDFTILVGGGAYDLAHGEHHDVRVSFAPHTEGEKSCLVQLGGPPCSEVPCLGSGAVYTDTTLTVFGFMGAEPNGESDCFVFVSHHGEPVMDAVVTLNDTLQLEQDNEIDAYYLYEPGFYSGMELFLRVQAPQGERRMRVRIPAAFSVTAPEPDARFRAGDSIGVAWTASPDAQAYLLRYSEDLETRFSSLLAPGVTTQVIPDSSVQRVGESLIMVYAIQGIGPFPSLDGSVPLKDMRGFWAYFESEVHVEIEAPGSPGSSR